MFMQVGNGGGGAAAGRIGLIVLLLMALAAAGGCAAMRPETDAAGPAELYAAGSYQAAYEAAASRARDGSTGRHDEMALLAGLSAFALHEETGQERWLEVAEQWLRPLTTTADHAIAGRASAALGLVFLQRERPATAIVYLSDAGRKLAGDEAARAHLHAGLAHLDLGRTNAARNAFRLAMAAADDPELRNQAQARLRSSAYTVQVGAFAGRSNAEDKAAAVSAAAERLGIGPVTITSRNEVGRRSLWLVHVGRFTGEQEARRAALRLGVESIVTLAEPE